MTYINTLSNMNNVTGSRSNNTTYQNTNSTAMFVMATTFTQGGGIRVYIENANPPTVQMCKDTAGDTAGHCGSISFIVPPGYYYKIIADSGFGIWIEYT